MKFSLICLMPLYIFAAMLPLENLSQFADGMNIEGGRLQSEYQKQGQIWANLCVVLDRPLANGIEWKDLKVKSVYPLKEACIKEYNECQVSYGYLTLMYYYILQATELVRTEDSRPVQLNIHVYRNSSGPAHLALLKRLIFKAFPDAFCRGDRLIINEHNVEVSFSSGVLEKDISNLEQLKEADINLMFSLVVGLHPKQPSGSFQIPTTHTPYPLEEHAYCPDKTYAITNHLLIDLEKVILMQPFHLQAEILREFPSENQAKISDGLAPLTLSDFSYVNLLEIDGIFNPSEQPDEFEYLQTTCKKVALITGVSQGIGYALTKTLVDAGWTVWGGTRTPAKWNGIEAMRPFYFDGTCPMNMKDIVQRIIAIDGRVDLLVHNAGALMVATFEESDPQSVSKELMLNFLSPLSLTQAVLPFMKAQNSGKIFALSSTATETAKPYLSVFSGTKSAFEKALESLAIEVQPWNIDVDYERLGNVKTKWPENAYVISNCAFKNFVEGSLRYGESPDAIARMIQAKVE